MKLKKKLALLLALSLIVLSAVTVFAASGSIIVIITKTGECYHLDGCRTLKSRIEITLQEAVTRGYRPCQVCNPPTLDSTQPTQPTPSEPITRQPSSRFNDVSTSAYYYNAVIDLSNRGIIGGFPDGSFKPNDTVTRAQLAVMLVNSRNISKENASSTFSDVPKSHWAYSYISAAAKVGYLSGYPDGSFKPEDKVSYNEAITMIVASLGYKMSDLKGSYPECFTNKAKEIGLLKTCSKIGIGKATRADVSCFLSDSFYVK